MAAGLRLGSIGCSLGEDFVQSGMQGNESDQLEKPKHLRQAQLMREGLSRDGTIRIARNHERVEPRSKNLRIIQLSRLHRR